MSHYYQAIGVTPSASTQEIESAIKKKTKEIEKNKNISQSVKNQMKTELKKIKHILTNYHQRRHYDEFYGSMLLTPSIPMSMTPSIPMSTMPSNEHSYSYNHSYSSTKTTNHDGTTIYSHQYQNNNGKEDEHYEKILIDKNGNKTRYILPNRYLTDENKKY
jgi:DnaJ-class molecular chaperone